MNGKVILVTEETKYPQHKQEGDQLAASLTELGYEVVRWDIQTVLPINEQLQSIIRLTGAGDIMMTLDFAGFEARTEMDNMGYNIIPVRMAHLILRNQISYPETLKGRINFSMFFYCSKEGIADTMKHQYPHINHIRQLHEKDIPHGILKDLE